MSDGRKVRWGIIGCGNIAGKVTPDIAAPETSELVAVASRDRAKAAEFAKKVGAPRAYGSYEEIYNDADVDAVYITTPNHRHREDTLAAIAAGKHVLCEKPMAATPGEVAEMFDAAEKAGVVLMEAFMYRFHPVTREVERRVKAGDLGEIRNIHARFCFMIGDKPENIRMRAETQGGAIMDIGCYCVNFARTMVGAEPEEVSAMAHVGAPGGVDEWAVATLRFPGEILMTLHCAIQAPVPTWAAVYGTKAGIEIPRPWVGDDDTQRYFYRQPTSNPEPELVSVPSPVTRYYLQTEAFNAAIQEGAPLLLTREDSIGQAAVLEKLRLSAGLGW